VTKIVNKQKYSSNVLDDRKLGSYFEDSELIYLCSQGTYRHTNFLDIAQYDIDAIMKDLLLFLNKPHSSKIHLLDYYNQNQKQKIEYFTLRYLVKIHGENYSIYFNGKSGVDRISTNKLPGQTSQRDVIIKAFQQTDSGMTKEEVSSLIRSKHLNHAAFYLNQLINDNLVVRIDRTMYNIPEKAFRNIDVVLILERIKEIINSTNLIVECDIFRKYVNSQLNLSYSKYFYASIVSMNLASLGLFKVNNLFSNNPIMYKSLKEIYLYHCDPDLSNKENLKRLQKILLITDNVAQAVINQNKYSD